MKFAFFQRSFPTLMRIFFKKIITLNFTSLIALEDHNTLHTSIQNICNILAYKCNNKTYKMNKNCYNIHKYKNDKQNNLTNVIFKCQ